MYVANETSTLYKNAKVHNTYDRLVRAVCVLFLINLSLFLSYFILFSSPSALLVLFSIAASSSVVVVVVVIIIIINIQ